MESVEVYTDMQEREGREAAAQASAEQERNEIDFRPLWERDVNYLVCSPNERRRLGDFAADMSDAILAGVSRLTASREVFNGPDDVDEEIEDEADVDEECE